MRKLTRKEKIWLKNLQKFLEIYTKSTPISDEEKLNFVKELGALDIPGNPYKPILDKVKSLDLNITPDNIDYEGVVNKIINHMKKGDFIIPTVKSDLLDKLSNLERLRREFYRFIGSDVYTLIFSGGRKTRKHDFIDRDKFPELLDPSLLNRETPLPEKKSYSFEDLLLLLQSLRYPKEVNTLYRMVYQDETEFLELVDRYVTNNDTKALEKALQLARKLDLPRKGGILYRGVPLSGKETVQDILSTDKKKKWLPTSRFKEVAKKFALRQSTGLINFDSPHHNKGVIEVWKVPDDAVLLDLAELELSGYGEAEVIIDPKKAKLIDYEYVGG